MKTSILSRFSSSMHHNEAKVLQEKLSSNVITKNVLPSRIIKVCGVDVAYKDNIAKGAAVIFDKNKKKIIETATSSSKVTSKYIPGLFMLREAKPILNTLKKLSKHYDLLLVDGNGRLHPRKCGLACFIGLVLDKPVIGVAKSLLCGRVNKDHTIEYDGEILGYEINQNGKKMYVSIGNKICLKMAVKIVNELGKNQYPEPLRLADSFSKK